MKCIILAAGEGTRMRPLTETTPKPMLKILGKQILEHILSEMPDEIDEAIIVVGYLSNQIMNYFGNKFGKIKIGYVIQKEKLGTYTALSLCRDFLGEGERFLLIYADDLHSKENLRRCIKAKTCSLLVYTVTDPKKFGVIEVDGNMNVRRIEEKPENPKTNLVSTGVMLLDNNIFKFPARQHKNGEYYLTDSIQQMIEGGYKFRAIESNFWLPIGYPEDLAKAEKFLGGILS